MIVNTSSGKESFGQELDSYYLFQQTASTPFHIQNNIRSGNFNHCKKKPLVHLDSIPHITSSTTWNTLHKKDSTQSIEFFFSEEESCSSSKVKTPEPRFATSVVFFREEPKSYLSTYSFSICAFGNANEMEYMRPASASECPEEDEEELKQILLSRKSPESIDSGRETALSNISHRIRHPTSDSIESLPSSGGSTIDRRDPKGSNISTVVEEIDNVQPASQSGSLKKGSFKRSSLSSLIRKSKGSKGTTETNSNESPGSSAAGTPTAKPKSKRNIFSSSKKHSAKHLAPGEEQKLAHGATFIPLSSNPNLDGFTTSGSQSSLVSSTQESASLSNFSPDPYAKSTNVGDREKTKSPTKKLSFMKSLTKKIKHGESKEKVGGKPSSPVQSGTSVSSEPKTLEQNQRITDLVQLSTEPKRLKHQDTNLTSGIAAAEKSISFNPPLTSQDTTEETMEIGPETPKKDLHTFDSELESPKLLSHLLQKAKEEAESEPSIDENPESQLHSFEKDYDAKNLVPTVRKSQIQPIGREIPLSKSDTAQEKSSPPDNAEPTNPMNKDSFLSITLRRADEVALDSESDRPVLDIRPEDEFRNSNILCGTDSITPEVSQAQEILTKVSSEVSNRPLSSMISLNPGGSGSANLVDEDNDESDVHYNLSRRRSSDFTDSFKKLEPFNFHLEAVPEGKRERLYKVLVVGELGTGKTSIIKRYVHQFFSNHYRATIGVDFALKVLRWDPETVVRLQLWDIAGQERFGSMTRVYYKEAVGAFIVFDVTRSATLEAVPKWKADLDSKVVLPDGRPIPTVLLANKSDQPKEGIAANREKMNEFVQQQGFSAWFETSAKENINIDESANFLVSKILEMDRWSQEPVSQDPDKVNIGGKNPKAGLPNNCAC